MQAHEQHPGTVPEEWGSVRHPVEIVDPAGARPRRRVEIERNPMPPDLRSTILLRGEDSGGHVSVVENVVPARSAGPPLHRHHFDETFCVLEGELVFRVGDVLLVRTAGQLAFAPRDAAHALANRRDDPARYLLVCTPAGFERQFARMAAQATGTEPPPWALQPVPEVVPLGPPILREVLDRLG
ncbi:cupin domain-containing protein [Geodermatophilus sp. SYSU D00697]